MVARVRVREADMSKEGIKARPVVELRMEKRSGGRPPGLKEDD